MDIFCIVLVGLILAALLAFRFKPDKSRFEINRLAAHSVKYKNLAHFLDIYPGLMVLVRTLVLISAIWLTILAAFSWGLFGGAGVALLAILLAFLLAHMLRGAAETLIGQHLEFFRKYFAWTEMLGRIVTVGDEPRIGSEQELMHLAEQGDFLDDHTKMLLKNVLVFRDQTVAKVMTLRDRIAFVHARDGLTPKLLDELFASDHKIFPVAQGSLDHIIGLLHLDDVLPISQEEKVLSRVVRKYPPPIDQDAPLESALNQMCEYNSTLLMVSKDDKIVGLVTLKDITRKLFSMVE
jgi:CBS domain containing-hemolysin-like protein